MDSGKNEEMDCGTCGERYCGPVKDLRERSLQPSACGPDDLSKSTEGLTQEVLEGTGSSQSKDRKWSEYKGLT